MTCILNNPSGYRERMKWMGGTIWKSVAGMQIRDDGGLNQLVSVKLGRLRDSDIQKFFEEATSTGHSELFIGR